MAESSQIKDTNRSVVQIIMMYDLCGWKNNRIATAVGLTEARVSIIRNSPLYINQRDERRKEMQSRVIETKAEAIASGDPVEEVFRSHALEMAEGLVEEARNGETAQVRQMAKKDILDRAGYLVKAKTTKRTIEVSEKIAGRLEAALRGDEKMTREITVRETMEEEG